MTAEIRGKKEPLPYNAQQRVQAVLVTREEPGPALSPKLERLLARQALLQKGRMAKLEKRLAKLQEPKSPTPTK